MKSRLLQWLLLTTAVASTVYAQSDVRVVNGAQVDLAPLHQWLSGKQRGERPLQHWHRVWVVDYRRTYGSWDLCVLRVESRAEIEVLVDHLPRHIRIAYQKYNQAKSELEALRTQIQAARSRLALLKRYGEYEPSPEAANLERNIEAAEHRLRLLVEQVGTRDTISFGGSGDAVSSSRISNGSLAAECARVSALPFFAMFTGRTYASYAIWDTGKLTASQ